MSAVSQTPTPPRRTATRIDREPSSTHDTSAAGTAKSSDQERDRGKQPQAPE